jgi:hypothetical protein
MQIGSNRSTIQQPSERSRSCKIEPAHVYKSVIIKADPHASYGTILQRDGRRQATSRGRPKASRAADVATNARRPQQPPVSERAKNFLLYGRSSFRSRCICCSVRS